MFAFNVTRKCCVFTAWLLLCVQVGSTLFVHGGVLPSHIEYGLERINQETRAWLLGQDPSSPSGTSSSSSSIAGSSGSSSSGSGRRYPPPAFLRGADAIVWARWVRVWVAGATLFELWECIDWIVGEYKLSCPLSHGLPDGPIRGCHLCSTQCPAAGRGEEGGGLGTGPESFTLCKI